MRGAGRGRAGRALAPGLGVFLALLPGASALAAQEEPPSAEERGWLARFRGLSELGASTEYDPDDEHPWGRPHPDAPDELEQFAFLVGEFDCAIRLEGLNPHDPDEVLEGDMTWRGFYAFNGRGIRDEFYSMSSVGQQLRLFDPETGRWEVTWATAPGLVDLGASLPNHGTFTARREPDGSMVMMAEARDARGRLYTNRVTFSHIGEGGFEWAAERVYPDEVRPQGSPISCVRTGGAGVP